jgi:hypothetical protein
MMKQDDKDVDWHIIYEGSALTCNSWIEEVAYLGNEQWLLRLYDDPSWSFEDEEPMQPEKKTSDELVAWVRYIDSASDKDSFARPREKSLYDVAIDLGATRCIELLSSIRKASQKENTEMKQTGKTDLDLDRFSIKLAGPDHPCYNRGFVIGGRRMKPSPVKNSKSEKKK